MVCSVPVPAPAAMPKSRTQPNWLDKLRKRKGFPSDEGHGLDHFLLTQSCPEVTSFSDDQTGAEQTSEASNPSQTIEAAPNRDGNETFSAMTSMLSDLFSDRRRRTAHKAARKQKNPKLCFPRTSPTAQDKDFSENGVTDGDDYAAAAAADDDVDDAARAGRMGPVLEDKESEEDCDLEGFSRTEVTVIDSSCPGWKFDNYLFRKNNVWKARERKGKPKSTFGSKKRKASTPCDATQAHWGRKKFKSHDRDRKKLLQAAMRRTVPSENANKETNGGLDQLPNKRESFFRSGWKSTPEVSKRKASSSNKAREVSCEAGSSDDASETDTSLHNNRSKSIDYGPQCHAVPFSPL